MARSISILDDKVMQADFFLEKLTGCRFEFFEARCYADAFTSAARSITFSMQAICAKVKDFEPWYAGEQERLKSDSACRFFNRYRTASIHIGDTPVSIASSRDGKALFFFRPTQDIPEVPEADVVTCCRTYFRTVVEVVFRMYKRFPFEFDDRWHYTREHFEARGLSILDALREFGYPKEWEEAGSKAGIGIDDQWRLLRRQQTSGPVIQDIFQKYLNMVVKGPDDTAP
jgi:hypothetical protein